MIHSRRRKPRYNRWLLSIVSFLAFCSFFFLFFKNYFCIQNHGHCSCTVLDLLWLHFSFLKDIGKYSNEIWLEKWKEDESLKALGETWVPLCCWELRLQCIGATLWSESTPTLRHLSRTNVRVKSQVGSFSPSLLETPSADLAGR